MPTVQNEYQEMILRARRFYQTEILPAAMEALVIEYALMIDRVQQDFARGRINAERANGLYLSFLDRLEELAIRLNATYDRAAAEAMRAAIQGHVDGLGAVSSLTGQTVTATFTSVPQRVVEDIMRRRGLGLATSFQTLVNRHMERIAGDVDELITDMVSRGVSSRRASVDLARMLAQDDPEVLRVLSQFSDRSSYRAIRDGVPGEVGKRIRGLIFDARRITVTEINTAYFESDRVAAAESPVVDLVKWQISGRHYALPSSPDACTIYFEGNHHGYGNGLFHPENVPAKPHPRCGCVLNSVTRPPSEWDNPKRPIPNPNQLSEREAERLMKLGAQKVKKQGGRPRKITEKHINRQTELSNDYLQRADQSARQVEIIQ